MGNFLRHNLGCNYRKDKDLPKRIKMSFYHEKKTIMFYSKLCAYLDFMLFEHEEQIVKSTSFMVHLAISLYI